jgi:hypothetical protein
MRVFVATCALLCPLPGTAWSGVLETVSAQPIAIADSVVWQGKDTTLDAPLEVLASGRLTLIGTTLRLNGSSTDSLYIRVRNGARMRILDGDGNPATTGDASRITVGDYPGFRYSFIVEEMASFEMKNSRMDHAGEAPHKISEEGYIGLLGNNKGFEVYAPFVVLEGNIFSDGYAGVTLYGDYNVVHNNRFEYLYKNGLVLVGSDFNEVNGNYFYEINFTDWNGDGRLTQAIAAYGCTGNLFVGNVVDDMTHGVYSKRYQRMVGSGIANYNCTYSTLLDNKMIAVHVWAFEFRDSKFNVMRNNEVVETHGDGAIFLTSDYNTLDGFRVGKAEFGVFLTKSNGCTIRNVVVDSAVELNGGGLRITGSSSNHFEDVWVRNSESGIILTSRGDLERYAMNRHNRLKNIYLENNGVSFQFDDPIGVSLGTEDLVIDGVFETGHVGKCINSTESSASRAVFSNAHMNLQSSHVTAGEFTVDHVLGAKVIDMGKKPLAGAYVSLSRNDASVACASLTGSDGTIPPQQFPWARLLPTGLTIWPDSELYQLNVTRRGYVSQTRPLQMDGDVFEVVCLERLRSIIGDINGDGKTDASDAVRLTHILFQESYVASSLPPAADLDGSGDVTLQDLALLTAYLYRGTTLVTTSLVSHPASQGWDPK